MPFSLPDIKKTIVIVGFIAIVVVLGWLIYVLFFKPPPPPEPPGPPTPPTPPGVLPPTPPGVEIPTVEPGAPGELPSAIARGGLTKTTTLTTNPVKNITISSDNELTYYDEISGQFFALDSQGQIVALSNKKFPQVQTVAWAPSAKSAIIEFPDGANIYYDFKTEKQVTLQKHWTEFNFSPDGDKITFKSIAMEPENNFLAIANPIGSGAQIIASLGEYAARVIPDWSPNRQIVASYTEPLDADRSSLFFLGLNDENFKKVVVNGYNFSGEWNPNGSQLLYSVSSTATNDNPSLWIVNAEGETIGSGRRPLNLETTADKCIFADTTTIYCAVPQFLPEGTGIMPSLRRGIPDDIYKVNLLNGTSAKLAELDIPLTITSLALSPDKKYLYFTDEIVGRLRSIRLK